jgi:hypothetical protein
MAMRDVFSRERNQLCVRFHPKRLAKWAALPHEDGNDTAAGAQVKDHLVWARLGEFSQRDRIARKAVPKPGLAEGKTSAVVLCVHRFSSPKA